MIVKHAHRSPRVYLNWEKINEINLDVNTKFIYYPNPYYKIPFLNGYYYNNIDRTLLAP